MSGVNVGGSGVNDPDDVFGDVPSDMAGDMSGRLCVRRVMLASGHVAVGLLLDAPVALALLRATRPVVAAGNIYIYVYIYIYLCIDIKTVLETEI